MTTARPIVLHVAFALDFGGVETHLRLISQTGGDKFDHQFCSLTKGGDAADAMRTDGSRVWELGSDPWRHPLACVANVRRLLRKIGVQVIHCHGADANVFGLTAALFARTQARIGEEVALRPHRMTARLVCRAAYKTAHRIVAVSDAVAHHLVALGEAPERKIERIYNPVQLSRLHAAPRQQNNPLRVGFVGRLAPEKNVAALIRALALVRQQFPCELLLIGDGPQRVSLELLADELNVREFVRFTGFSKKPEEQLSTCHLYVQPSLHEGMGIALVEAMSCGLPAIVSDKGGMREIVRDGNSGWVLSGVEPIAIAQAMTDAADLTPDRLAAMGEQARQSVAKTFDPGRYVQTIEAMYRNVLGHARGA